jgi:type IV pilus assembly protein PilM
VENFAEIPTPTGAVAEGAVADPMAITGVLANIWSALRLRQPRVGTVIGGSGVLIRHVNYPRMSKAELSRALSFDIDQHLPIPRDQAVFDYAVAEAASVSQPGQMPVMIVGAQRRLVEGQLLALKKARLRAQTIDLDALAILRGLRFSGLIPFGSQEPLVVLDLGATATRVNIFVNGVPVLTRAVPLDNRALTQVIVDGLGVDRQEAERLKREQGLVSGSRVAELLRSPLEEMLSAVSRSVEFFMIQNRGLSLSQVYLTGGGAQLPGLAPMALEYLAGTLSERFPNIGALDVRVASLPGKLAAHRRLLGVIQHLGPQFLSALGAALREEVEK